MNRGRPFQFHPTHPTYPSCRERFAPLPPSSLRFEHAGPRSRTLRIVHIVHFGTRGTVPPRPNPRPTHTIPSARRLVMRSPARIRWSSNSTSTAAHTRASARV